MSGYYYRGEGHVARCSASVLAEFAYSRNVTGKEGVEYFMLDQLYMSIKYKISMPVPYDFR